MPISRKIVEYSIKNASSFKRNNIILKSFVYERKFLFDTVYIYISCSSTRWLFILIDFFKFFIDHSRTSFSIRRTYKFLIPPPFHHVVLLFVLILYYATLVCTSKCIPRRRFLHAFVRFYLHPTYIVFPYISSISSAL